MKIIDAFWEERNLGVTCYELELVLADRTDEVAAALDNLGERQYMVAKIPASRFDLLQLFQGRGYSFIETAIKLEYDYKKLNYQPPAVPDALKRIQEKCSWGPMNQDELSQLSCEIKNNMFTTDRIYVDPAFTHEQAARRYDLWVKDLIARGAVPYKAVVGDEIIGFFIGEQISEGLSRGTLGGLYEEYKASGMGYWYLYATFMCSREHGVKKCVTQVSACNPAILKLHTTFGAAIKGCEYVLVKHT